MAKSRPEGKRPFDKIPNNHSMDPRADHGAPVSGDSTEPVGGAQRGKPDRRVAGRLHHDHADHDSLAGSGSGLGSPHRPNSAAAGGDRSSDALGDRPNLANKAMRDSHEPHHFGDDPAGHHTLTGSGDLKDSTEFAKITDHLDESVMNGAEVDDGAMEAWGGLAKFHGYSHGPVGQVDIERNGYPMQGEPTSQGHIPKEHPEG